MLGAMNEQRNKAIVNRFIVEYQNHADERAFAELLHPDVVDHSRPPGIAEGSLGVRQQFDGFRAAFDGFHAEVLDQLAEDDRVMTRKVFRGVHTGEFAGIPPTGREVEIHVIDIVRIVDGRIAEHWNIVDRLGLMAQLGALDPAPAGATA
jgi:predicted ester cyclase